VRPLVSFVIPVKNDAQRLRHCLTSILSNTYPRELIEIIVVDNGSSDGSGRVARDCGAVVLNSTTGSVAELRNRGARAALGTILAFADSDHELDPNWIETATEILSDPSIAATGAPPVSEPTANWVQQQYDGLRDRPASRQDVTWLGSGNLAVKRAAFAAANGFNAQLIACEDVDLCNRLRAAGHRIVADPALKSIHFGDPRTLKALFFGELWRGRNNLQVTFRGPKTLRAFRSALIPVVQLWLLCACAVAIVMQWWMAALIMFLVALAPAAARAAVMLKRKMRRSIGAAAQAFAVAVTFDAARAFSLLFAGTHQSRRAA
jgi:glycosyltransferase involved in cell wall biosynthesis